MRILSPGTTRANVIRSALTGLLIAGTVAGRAAAATPPRDLLRTGAAYLYGAEHPGQSCPACGRADHRAAVRPRRDPSGTND